MTRSKAIGTRAETAVLRYALPWFPDAERLALYGSQDHGDIRLCAALNPKNDWSGGNARWNLPTGGVMAEVKAGKAAKNAGALQVAQWAAETEAERLNGGFAFGVLVVQRFNPYVPGAAGWSAVLPLGSLTPLIGAGLDSPAGLWVPPYLESDLWTSDLRNVLRLLRHAGYGAPLTPDEQENHTP